MSGFSKTIVSLILLSCISSHAAASIIYSGELSLEGPNLNVDIDGNGEVDFSGKWTGRLSGSNGSFAANYGPQYNPDISYVAERLLGFETYPGYFAALMLGAKIGLVAPADLLWAGFSGDGMFWQSANSYLDPVIYTGAWSHVTDKYLGFQLHADSLSYFGWMRFSTSSAGKITLHDYAYEDTPDTAILAGATQVPAPSSLALLLLALLLPLRPFLDIKGRSKNSKNRSILFGLPPIFHSYL